jgi:hypothetical protein
MCRQLDPAEVGWEAGGSRSLTDIRDEEPPPYGWFLGALAVLLAIISIALMDAAQCDLHLYQPRGIAAIVTSVLAVVAAGAATTLGVSERAAKQGWCCWGRSGHRFLYGPRVAHRLRHRVSQRDVLKRLPPGGALRSASDLLRRFTQLVTGLQLRVAGGYWRAGCDECAWYCDGESEDGVRQKAASHNEAIHAREGRPGGQSCIPARHGSAFGTGREEWKILALHEPRLLDGALAGA